MALADNAQRVYELLDALKEAKSACCDMGLEETFLTQFSNVQQAWEQEEFDTVRKEFANMGSISQRKYLLLAGATVDGHRS